MIVKIIMSDECMSEHHSDCDGEAGVVLNGLPHALVCPCRCHRLGAVATEEMQKIKNALEKSV